MILCFYKLLYILLYYHMGGRWMIYNKKDMGEGIGELINYAVNSIKCIGKTLFNGICDFE